MKRFVLSVLLGLVIMAGGLMYRVVVDERTHALSCPVQSRTCPDGTQVTHAADSCDFPTCAPPNVTLASAKIVFALPEGYEAENVQKGELARFGASATSSEQKEQIVVRMYPILATSTAVEVMQATALRVPSGERVSPADFASLTLGPTYRFAAVTVQKTDTAITVAYYLARPTDVLRFDATDYGVNGTDGSLVIAELPAQKAVRALLGTLQSE
jgi:hypothetical protein